MGRGGRKRPVAPEDLWGMRRDLAEFLESLRVRGYSEATLVGFHKYVMAFILWGEARGLTRPQEVTKPILDRYQRHLYYYRSDRINAPLSFRTQHARLVAIRAFFRWLAKGNYILYNPASDLELPRVERRLPRFVLTADEVERIMNQVDMKDPLAARDRAILETFYSTGMRRTELVNLRLLDLDIERKTVMIRQGKGKKDRYIPIGERALAWIGKYLDEVRPELVVEPDSGMLFLTVDGGTFTPCRMTQLTAGYIEQAQIGKRGSCHLFRHTMATLMLENGADIRFIQQMLGHAQLSTTEIYTQVSLRKLQEIFMATHPSARLDSEREGARGQEPGS